MFAAPCTSQQHGSDSGTPQSHASQPAADDVVTDGEQQRNAADEAAANALGVSVLKSPILSPRTANAFGFDFEGEHHSLAIVAALPYVHLAVVRARVQMMRQGVVTGVHLRL